MFPCDEKILKRVFLRNVIRMLGYTSDHQLERFWEDFKKQLEAELEHGRK